MAIAIILQPPKNSSFISLLLKKKLLIYISYLTSFVDLDVLNIRCMQILTMFQWKAPWIWNYCHSIMLWDDEGWLQLLLFFQKSMCVCLWLHFGISPLSLRQVIWFWFPGWLGWKAERLLFCLFFQNKTEEI